MSCSDITAFIGETRSAEGGTVELIDIGSNLSEALITTITPWSITYSTVKIGLDITKTYTKDNKTYTVKLTAITYSTYKKAYFCKFKVCYTEVTTGSISCVSSPTGASVFLDSVDKSQVTPYIITGVSSGSHRIDYYKDGYITCRVDVTVTAGETITANCTLEKTFSLIRWTTCQRCSDANYQRFVAGYVYNKTSSTKTIIIVIGDKNGLNVGQSDLSISGYGTYFFYITTSLDLDYTGKVYCGGWYNDVSQFNQNKSQHFDASDNCADPSIPTAVSAACQSNGGCLISWTAPSDSDIYYYILLRYKNDVEDELFYVDTTSFTDNTITDCGTSYKYEVMTVDKCERASVASTKVTATAYVALGTLDCTSLPTGATIWVKDRSPVIPVYVNYGTTNLIIELAPGTYDVMYELTGYEIYITPEPVTFLGAEDYTLHVDLVALREPPCRDYGDVNADGYVTSADAELALKHAMDLIELTEAEQKRADVDTDGEVTAKDAMLIGKYAAGIIDGFPACIPCSDFGDINGDGFVTAEDSTLALNYVVGTAELTALQIMRGDVNKDGRLSTGDSTLINRFVNGDIDTFPVCVSCSKIILEIDETKTVKDCTVKLISIYADNITGALYDQIVITYPWGATNTLDIRHGNTETIVNTIQNYVKVTSIPFETTRALLTVCHVEIPGGYILCEAYDSITEAELNANIQIDGTSIVPKTPHTTIELSIGSHTITFILDGYVTQDVDVTVKSGQTVTARADMIEDEEEYIFTSLSIEAVPSLIGVGQYSEIRGDMYIEGMDLILPGLPIKLYINKGQGFVYIATPNTPPSGTGLFDYEYLAIQEDVNKILKFKYVFEGSESLELAASESGITSLTIQEEAILTETKIELSANPNTDVKPTTVVKLTAYLTDINDNPLPNDSFVNFYKEDTLLGTSGTIDCYAYWDYTSIIEDSEQTITFSSEYLGIENEYDSSEDSVDVIFKEIPELGMISNITYTIIKQILGDEVEFNIPITNTSDVERCYYVDLYNEIGEFVDRAPNVTITGKFANVIPAGATKTIVMKSEWELWIFEDIIGQNITFKLRTAEKGIICPITPGGYELADEATFDLSTTDIRINANIDNTLGLVTKDLKIGLLYVDPTTITKTDVCGSPINVINVTKSIISTSWTYPGPFNCNDVAYPMDSQFIIYAEGYDNLDNRYIIQTPIFRSVYGTKEVSLSITIESKKEECYIDNPFDPTKCLLTDKQATFLKWAAIGLAGLYVLSIGAPMIRGIGKAFEKSQK